MFLYKKKSFAREHGSKVETLRTIMIMNDHQRLLDEMNHYVYLLLELAV